MEVLYDRFQASECHAFIKLCDRTSSCDRVRHLPPASFYLMSLIEQHLVCRSCSCLGKLLLEFGEHEPDGKTRDSCSALLCIVRYSGTLRKCQELLVQGLWPVKIDRKSRL